MKKITSVSLILLLIFSCTSIAFADTKPTTYSDTELYDLAKEGIYINTDTVKVRDALPNEVIITDISNGLEVVNTDFVVIQRNIKAPDTATLFSSEEPNEDMSFTVEGFVTFKDTRDISGSDTSYTVRANNIFNVSTRNIIGPIINTVAYKPTSFGGNIISVDSGFNVTKFVCSAGGDGSTYSETGTSVSPHRWTDSLTVSSGNLFARNTKSVNYSYYFASGISILSNNMTVHWKRATGTQEYTFVIQNIITQP